ncbi:MAG TPA: CNNM domain-containing protein, partial [Elusimicrobiota bacterium]|nr:CNNM domain-containing protein [Elusimicrobiota bacterium]
MTLLIHLALFGACLGATALFSAAETALTSVSLSAWDRLRQENPALSPAYRLWTTDPSLVLAALLFGNTLMSLGASIVG